MKAEDKVRLESATFDREAWASLWDRLPEKARPGAAAFVLQKLHALESSGRWSISWWYETSEQREESGLPIFEYDQPGDVITFKGSLQIGSVSETKTDSESIVSVACLSILDWQALSQAFPDSTEFGNSFEDFMKNENQRFARLVEAGKNPCRVLVPAAEFLEWCSSTNCSPDAGSLDAFAAERLRQEVSRYVKWHEGQ